MKSLTKYEHFQSKTHTSFRNSIILRYFILNPNFDEIDLSMRKFDINYNEKYEEYVVPCLINLLTTANRVRYIRINQVHINQFMFLKN